MNIKIIDSWLREYLDTKANTQEVAKELSLTSVSVDRTEKSGDETVYDIEVTTNRPDLMSVMGIAREASAALTQQGITSKYIPQKLKQVPTANISFPIEIKNDPKLVNRIMAVIMEVEIAPSPKKISERLEKSGIRSLNNVIDITNYVMREIGHPCHVFDYDLLNTKQLIIRESKAGEVLTTLDGKQYRLIGGDIVADDGSGQIVDLLGVMGTANSVVKDTTKRIMFFLDNNDPKHIRKTSMNLGIRTEAAIINEKGIDPDLMEAAFKRGIEMYQDIAKGKVVSKILDIYPNKPKEALIKVSLKKMSRIIGIEIPAKKSAQILESLGFKVKILKDFLEVIVPTIRSQEVLIEEDVVEEVARIYGYHKLPSTLPAFFNDKPTPYTSEFYFEEKVKNALRYWGFSESYTSPLISENQFDGPLESALKLKNPLTDDMKYLRNSLVPSLLQVIDTNKNKELIKIFEIANIYRKRPGDLPYEISSLGGVIKKPDTSFFELKGIIENLLADIGIRDIKLKTRAEGHGADISIGTDKIGYIEILSSNLLDFELNFQKILEYANDKKIYKPLAKFPPIIEDITFVLDNSVNTQDVISEIKLQSFLIQDVTFKDQFQESRTFHIIYQAEDKNLTNKEVLEIKNQIIKSIKEKFSAEVK